MGCYCAYFTEIDLLPHSTRMVVFSFFKDEKLSKNLELMYPLLLTLETYENHMLVHWAPVGYAASGGGATEPKALISFERNFSNFFDSFEIRSGHKNKLYYKSIMSVLRQK